MTGAQSLVGLGLVIKALQELGVPFVLCGSFASSIHGEARATRDADLLVDLDPSLAEELSRRLGQTFYADPVMMRSSIAHKISFNVIHLPTGFKIDFFSIGTGAFERSELARAQTQPLGVLEVPVTSPEDTLLAKLRWYRMGGETSEMQWRDIAGIVSLQRGRLDRAYLEEWAHTLGVADLLARALAGETARSK